MPISLDSISSIMQCSISSSKKLLPSPKPLPKYDACHLDSVKNVDNENDDAENLANTDKDNADNNSNNNNNNNNSQISLKTDNAIETDVSQTINSEESTLEKLKVNDINNNNNNSIDDNNDKNINGDNNNNNVNEKVNLNAIKSNNPETVTETTPTLNVLENENVSAVRNSRKVSRNESLNSSRSSSSSSTITTSSSSIKSSRSNNNSMVRSNSQDSSISDMSNNEVKKIGNFIEFSNINDKKLNESCSSRASSPQSSVSSSFSAREENDMGFTFRKSRVSHLKQRNLTVYDMLSQIVGFSTLSIKVISKYVFSFLNFFYNVKISFFECFEFLILCKCRVKHLV
jgi:hypothetical protein